MYKKILELSEYVGWIFKKYQELQAELKNINAYQILDIIKSPDGTIKIKIRITGTGKTVEWYPEEIVADDALLEGFSKKDIRTITYFACKEISNPQYKIIAHEFSEKLSKTIFRFKKRKSNSLIEKTAADISTDKDFIKQCSPEDAHRAGYLFGSEETEKEREFIEKNRSS